MSNLKYIMMWLGADSEHRWASVRKDEVIPMLKMLLEEGVVANSVFFVPIQECKWMCPTFHNGKKTVWPEDFSKELYSKCEYKATPVAEEATTHVTEDCYGYISPDGRYFHCSYGGHAECARKIVGLENKVIDACRYLEDKGWAVIHKNPLDTMHKYNIGTGSHNKLTDAQIQKITELGIIDSSHIWEGYL